MSTHLSHRGREPIQFRVEADFTGTGQWADVTRFTVPPGQSRASFPGRFRRLLAPRERGQSNNGDGYFDLRINSMRATASPPSFFRVAPALAALPAWPSLAVLAQPIRAQHVLLEAAQFGDTGGWDVDQQSMDVMGSPDLRRTASACR